MGLSQISSVDGSSGVTVDFPLGCRGAAHDPECDCRAAEAPIQGRFQRPPLRGAADPAGGLLVSALFLELPRYRGALPRARSAGRPFHREPLGPGLLAADRASAAILPQTALRAGFTHE